MPSGPENDPIVEEFGFFLLFCPPMFLRLLYQKWKTLFWILVVMMGLQAFFMFKGVETVPFFLYSLYSLPLTPADTTAKTVILINGKAFEADRLTSREQETLMASFSYYQYLRQHGFLATDPATIEKRLSGKLPRSWYPAAYHKLTNSSVNDTLFLHWWVKYLSRVSAEKIDSVSMFQTHIAWKPQYHPLNDTIFNFHYVAAY
jgi:hypothetical protein